ncbi:MAG: AAA family ATPase [Phycicoccus sp.]
MEEYGRAFKRHVKETYDVYVHLEHELPIAADGHRPMNEQFRTTIDAMLLETLDDLSIPYHRVRGSMPERLAHICDVLDLSPVMGVSESIDLARRDYAAQYFRMETERMPAALS